MKSELKMVLTKSTLNFEKYLPLLIVIICIISRLPLLLSDNLLLDGDECIVGLMAKHFVEGKEFPIYFYGQSYGFSFIEVISISLFYLIFGFSAIAVKLGMLMMFIIGVLFFYKTLKFINTTNVWLPFLICLIFVLSPSLAVWSMKARGGYLTAFLLTSIVIFFCLKKSSLNSVFYSITIGVLAVVIFESQPLWIAGVIPFVIYYLIVHFSAKKLLMFVISVLIFLMFFQLFKNNLPNYWEKPPFSLQSFSFENFLEIPRHIFIHFSGNFYYNRVLEFNYLLLLISGVLCLMFFVAVVLGIFKNRSKMSFDPIYLTVLFSIILTLSYTPLMKGENYRYLLPLGGIAFLSIFLVLKNSINYRIINFFLILFIVLESVHLFNLKNYSIENRKEISSIIDEIDSKKVHFAFCDGGLLQWQIVFYSTERIKTRFLYLTDRYPDYIEQVNNAYIENSKNVVLITSESSGINHDFQGKMNLKVHDNINDSVLIVKGFELK